MLSKWRISMTNDCKEKGMKNIIKEMLNSIKNERQTVGQLAIENCDAHEEMAKDCTDFENNEVDESDQSNSLSAW